MPSSSPRWKHRPAGSAWGDFGPDEQLGRPAPARARPVQAGGHLGGLWHLTPLADWPHTQGHHRLRLTVPPLHLAGAIASPVTPIATV